ncbi:MAG: hypothetical protein HYR73_06720, partial [Candidatus Eisenbacteria bacterium]|nr:hypothetical protein [Candidatus Eisenbacteria bacterium]
MPPFRTRRSCSSRKRDQAGPAQAASAQSRLWIRRPPRGGPAAPLRISLQSAARDLPRHVPHLHGPARRGARDGAGGVIRREAVRRHRSLPARVARSRRPRSAPPGEPSHPARRDAGPSRAPRAVRLPAPARRGDAPREHVLRGGDRRAGDRHDLAAPSRGALPGAAPRAGEPRRVVDSPFGLAVRGIHENRARMAALGTPVVRRLLAMYTLAGGLAGAAGALSAQTNAIVGLDSLSFALSAEALVMLILGGAGRLHGALVGAVVFTLLHHTAAS